MSVNDRLREETALMVRMNEVFDLCVRHTLTSYLTGPMSTS
jgi:hypothetical protein